MIGHQPNTRHHQRQCVVADADSEPAVTMRALTVCRKRGRAVAAGGKEMCMAMRYNRRADEPAVKGLRADLQGVDDQSARSLNMATDCTSCCACIFKLSAAAALSSTSAEFC